MQTLLIGVSWERRFSDFLCKTYIFSWNWQTICSSVLATFHSRSWHKQSRAASIQLPPDVFYPTWTSTVTGMYRLWVCWAFLGDLEGGLQLIVGEGSGAPWTPWLGIQESFSLLTARKVDELVVGCTSWTRTVRDLQLDNPGTENFRFGCRLKLGINMVAFGPSLSVEVETPESHLSVE